MVQGPRGVQPGLSGHGCFDSSHAI
jgi:hypothetical protein